MIFFVSFFPAALLFTLRYEISMKHKAGIIIITADEDVEFIDPESGWLKSFCFNHWHNLQLHKTLIGNFILYKEEYIYGVKRIGQLDIFDYMESCTEYRISFTPYTISLILDNYFGPIINNKYILAPLKCKESIIIKYDDDGKIHIMKGE